MKTEFDHGSTGESQMIVTGLLGSLRESPTNWKMAEIDTLMYCPKGVNTSSTIT